MKVTLLTIGKFKSREFSTLAADYAGRIAHYLPFEYLAVKDEKKALEKVSPGDYLVVLDERGATFSSPELASFIEEHQVRSTKRMIFFVGDAMGVGPELKKRAAKMLSLSKMTFPHELAQVITLEQIYRACTIVKGEKYHYG